MAIDIKEYIRADNSNPYRKWFDGLDAVAAAKVTVAVVRMSGGNTSSIKWFSGIGECKIDWGPGYRVYLARDGDSLLILFGGGTKKTQDRDIAKAMELNNEYKTRKAVARKPSSQQKKRK